MAENDAEIVEELDDLDTELETLEAEDSADDTIDWKAEAKKAKGLAKRYKTKLEKAKSAPPAANKVEQKADEQKGFDYAEKAYLKASGIQSDEFDLVREVMQSTGKSLDEVLEAKYFQAELKDRRDAKASKDAIPSGTKRPSQSSRDSVDYWIAKGELPPADQKELRQQVVNARIKSEKMKSQFTDHSVV